MAKRYKDMTPAEKKKYHGKAVYQSQKKKVEAIKAEHPETSEINTSPTSLVELLNYAPVNPTDSTRGVSAIDAGQASDNQRYIANCIEISNLPPIDIYRADQVEQRCREYFEIVMKNNMKPNLPGLALALGTTRKTIYKWVGNDEMKNFPESVRQVVRKYHTILNVQIEDYMQNGKVNPASGIFIMKNNYGYVDEIKQTIEHKEMLTAENTEEEIRKKYEEDFIIDAEFTPKGENEL